MNYNEFKNSMMENDPELKKEYELLKTKYELIEAIINFRKTNNYTRKDVAKMMNVKVKAIKAFELGESDVSIVFLSKLLDVIGLEMTITPSKDK